MESPCSLKRSNAVHHRWTWPIDGTNPEYRPLSPVDEDYEYIADDMLRSSPVFFSNSDDARVREDSPVSPISETFQFDPGKISFSPPDSPVSPISDDYEHLSDDSAVSLISSSPSSLVGPLSEGFEHVPKIASPISFSSDDTDSSDAYHSFEATPEEALPDCKCPPDRMSFDAVPTIPTCLKDWFEHGQTACSIGLALHRFVYGQDATLMNLVTTGVDSGKAYCEICKNVMRNMHLRTENGAEICDLIEDGQSLKATPELWRMPPEHLSVFAQATAGLMPQDSADRNPKPGKPKGFMPQRKHVRIAEPAVLVPRQKSTWDSSDEEIDEW